VQSLFPVRVSVDPGAVRDLRTRESHLVELRGDRGRNASPNNVRHVQQSPPRRDPLCFEIIKSNFRVVKRGGSCNRSLFQLINVTLVPSFGRFVRSL